MDYLQYLNNGELEISLEDCFKPYYKWITFNTLYLKDFTSKDLVLNLIINGLPSIQNNKGCVLYDF